MDLLEHSSVDFRVSGSRTSPSSRSAASRFLSVALPLALAAFTAPLPSQVNPDSARFEVLCRVIDDFSGEGIPEVLVRSRPLGLQGFTDSTGALQFPVFETGTFFFEFEKDGYRGLAGLLQIDRAGKILVPLTRFNPPVRTDAAVIAGRILDATSEDPLEGVLVSPGSGIASTLSDSLGRFSLQNVPPGPCRLSFSRLGYEAREVELDVGARQRVDLSVPMTTEPISLAPVEIVVERRDLRLELAGFYERRNLGFGQFLGPEQLEGRAVSKTTDLFNDFHGIRFVNKEAMGGVEETIAFHRGQGVVTFNAVRGICYPDVWIDDVLATGGGEEPAVLNLRLSPRDVAAIEVYQSAAQLPSRFSGTGRACGVIVIWTGR